MVYIKNWMEKADDMAYGAIYRRLLAWSALAALRSQDPERRDRAIRQFAGLGPSADEFVHHITSLFRHPDAGVRRDAVVVVGRIGPNARSAIPNIIECLADADRLVRWAAIQSVLQLDPSAMSLVGALRHADREVRNSVLETLPHIITLGPMHIDALVEHLPIVDKVTARRIQSILIERAPFSLPALVRGLEQVETREALLRMSAAMASRAIWRLSQIAREEDDAISGQAVQVLGAIGPRAIPALVDLLRAHRNSKDICMQLIRLGAHARVIAALGSGLPRLRDEAARALRDSRGLSGTDGLDLLEIASRGPEDARLMAADIFRSVVPDIRVRIEILLDAVTYLFLEFGRDALSIILDRREALSILADIVLSERPDVRAGALDLLENILPNFETIDFAGLSTEKRQMPPLKELTSGRLNPLLEALSRSLTPDWRGARLSYLDEEPEPEHPDIQALVVEVQEPDDIQTYVVQGADNDEAAVSEPTRYTDVAIYKGKLFPINDLASEEKLDDGAALIAGEAYTLEVAIRAKRTGIESDQEAPRGVVNPRENREPLTVYVLVSDLGPVLEFQDRLAKMTWPYDEDSESALLRFTPGRLDISATTTQTIEIRLYDASLDLLDIVQLRIDIRHANAKNEERSGEKANRLVWPDKPVSAPVAGAASTPRVMSINVNKTNAGYRFEFLVCSKDGTVLIPISRNIQSSHLEALLKKVRNFWTELVIGTYAESISVSRPCFATFLARLHKLGTEAWALVFGARYGNQAASPEALGELLTRLDFQEGSHIQITYSDEACDFIFPWNILYPRLVVSDHVDPLAFWGARFQIEQVSAGPIPDSLHTEPVNVLFGLDPGFDDSDTQRDLWARYQSTSAGKIIVSRPASDQASFLEELTRLPAPHFVYLFCHGYAAAPGIFRPEGVNLLKQRLEEMAPDSPERRAFETLLMLTAKMGDESWIYLGGSEITESVLRDAQYFDKRRPIVFLNMCQSAELLPSMYGGITRVFLDHDATAVVGTESPMTATFASEFARVVLDALLGGSTIGTALFNARRHFLSNDLRNPLGLAYTLYGRATAKLGTGPLINATPQTEAGEN